MTLDLPGLRFVAIGAVAVAGLAGSVVALGGRGVEAEFLHEQRHPPNLQAADVERVVKTAPDPRTGKGAGVSANCSRGGTSPVGNPWSCVVSYPSGRRVRIAVRITADGYYHGRYAGGGAASGCCIDLPGTR